MFKANIHYGAIKVLNSKKAKRAARQGNVNQLLALNSVMGWL